MYRPQRLLTAALVASALLALSPLAQAEELKLHAHMTAASEVPPKNSPATGDVEATFDTATDHLVFTATYKNLTGPATMAHFHGPAAAGVNAGVIVPVKGDLSSPIRGEATLTPEQAADLIDGKWYFNVHTAANPGGEIRGQVTH
jgi:hypothetical protein